MALSPIISLQHILNSLLRNPTEYTKECCLRDLELYIKKNQEQFIKRLLAKLFPMSGVDYKGELRTLLARVTLVNVNAELTENEKKHIIIAFYKAMGHNFVELFNLNEKEQLQLLYPAGTKLRLTKEIDDPYTPKDVGDIFTVDYIDDIGNIHGNWESGGTMALVSGVDSYEIITE